MSEHNQHDGSYGAGDNTQHRLQNFGEGKYFCKEQNEMVDETTYRGIYQKPLQVCAGNIWLTYGIQLVFA